MRTDGDGMKKHGFVDRTLVLYLILGILNFIVCTVLMFLLFNKWDFSEHLAPVVNYGLGSLLWYLSCRFVLFREQKTSLRQILRFILEVLACYLISYYLIAPPISRLLLLSPSVQRFFAEFGGVGKLTGNCEMSVGVIVYAFLNYFGQRYYVFSRRFDHRKKTEK